MKFLKLLVLIIVMFLLIVFVAQNDGHPVPIKFLFSTATVEMDAVILIFISFLIGLLLGFLYSGFQILAAKNHLRVLNNEYQKLKKEVDLLRNQGLSDEEISQ